jgi:H+/Cl- antiporter ClcA
MSTKSKTFELVCLEDEEQEVTLGAQPTTPTSSSGNIRPFSTDMTDDNDDEEDALTTTYEDDLNEVLRREDLYPWFNVILIAVTVGTVEYIPLFFLGISINAKYKYLDELITSSGLIIMTVANVIFSCLCVVTAALTTRLVPCTAGSGVPPLIGYLYNGRKVDRSLFTSQMVLIKMIGVELAIVGGLAVGREGPAIHIGAAIGDLTNRLINKTIRMYTGKKVPFSGAVKSNVVMMGATCGFASAFRSPIGGMLYCVEEIATHWDIKSHMSVGAQTFVAASIAAFTTQIILNVSSKSGQISFSSIIIFSEEEANAGTTKAAYQYHDLPGFLVTAIICGLLAGVTTRISNWLRVWKNTPKAPSSPLKQVLCVVRDAILVATLTTLCFSIIPLVYKDCQPEPGLEDTDGHRLLSGGGGDRTYVQYTCADGKYSQLASLSLAGEEGVIRHLLSRDGEEFKLLALIIFLVVYLPISVVTRLIPIPMGSFVPNLLIGALVGRIVGEAMQTIYPSSVQLSLPGVFALLGAASMLGAWTRTMMAVVVTLLEITGDIGMVSPLICGVVIARSIATRIADHSYTHELFYALIDDPDSDGPLILHPNDWKPQKKVVDEASATKQGSFRNDKEENQKGQRTSVTLATPTGTPRLRGQTIAWGGFGRGALGAAGPKSEEDDGYYAANTVGFASNPTKNKFFLRTQSSNSVDGRVGMEGIDEDVDDSVGAEESSLRNRNGGKQVRRKSAGI